MTPTKTTSELKYDTCIDEEIHPASARVPRVPLGVLISRHQWCR